MSMTLREIRDIHQFNTGKASEITRQLALAGIAVIWLFKTTSTSTPIPKAYLLPLWFFLAALLLDLMQYVIAGLVWTAFEKKREREAGNSSGDTLVNDSPGWINSGAWTCWTLKIALMAAGYFWLLREMWAMIWPM
jgi:hypothetical protein